MHILRACCFNAVEVNHSPPFSQMSLYQWAAGWETPRERVLQNWIELQEVSSIKSTSSTRKSKYIFKYADGRWTEVRLAKHHHILPYGQSHYLVYICQAKISNGLFISLGRFTVQRTKLTNCTTEGCGVHKGKRTVFGQYKLDFPHHEAYLRALSQIDLYLQPLALHHITDELVTPKGYSRQRNHLQRGKYEWHFDFLRVL